MLPTTPLLHVLVFIMGIAGQTAQTGSSTTPPPRLPAPQTNGRQDMRALSDVQKESKTQASDVTPPTALPLQCDVISQSGCDVGDLERCLEPGYCGCLQGHVRTKDTKRCVAAQFFRGQISFVDTFSSQLLNTKSDHYRRFVDDVQKMILHALLSQGARGVLDVYVTSVTRDLETGHVVVAWEVGVTPSSHAQREGLMRAYNKGVVNESYVDPEDGLVKLGGPHFVLGRNGSMANFLQPITEFSQCTDKNHNYCDVNADCFHGLGSFTCACRPGYEDVSPDIKAAKGERCVESCPCQNDGTCSRDEAGDVECSCPSWFTGSRCQVDGKAALIISCSVVGGLLVITAILCLVCMCTPKRSRASSRESTLGVDSLDTSVVKLPRVAMEPRLYDLPPRDIRRWSFVSEPVRYVDEYMMDDYGHAGTLTLPTAHSGKKKGHAHSSAMAGTGTLNLGYSSSTLSGRTFPRR